MVGGVVVVAHDVVLDATHAAVFEQEREMAGRYDGFDDIGYVRQHGGLRVAICAYLIGYLLEPFRRERERENADNRRDGVKARGDYSLCLECIVDNRIGMQQQVGRVIHGFDLAPDLFRLNPGQNVIQK
jgi:hypothetical protein